jgi:hypothetical protein
MDEAGSPAPVASAGGRYFGFVTWATSDEEVERSLESILRTAANS